jgi:cell division septum initiation protein DivIVA
MARRESPPAESTDPKANSRRRGVDFDIQQQLAQLQELIYDSFRIPLTAWSVIDEDRILDQIDIVSDSIPDAIQKALAILDQEERILAQAEEYAQRLVQSAQQDAARILDESGIIQQAQQEAQQIRQQVQQECELLQRQTQQECDSLQRQVRQDCEALQRQIQQECDTLQRQTLGELEQIRQVTTQEVQQYRQQTVQECQELQRDADQYADQVLTRLENHIAEMMRTVGSCRQILYENSAHYEAPPPVVKAPSTVSSSPPAPRPERPPRKRSR